MLFDQVCRWWDEQGFEVIAGDETPTEDPPLPFSLAAARNAVVSMADDRDVVILSDADTIPWVTVVKQAVEMVSRDPALVIYPFNEYCYLSRQFALDMVHYTTVKDVNLDFYQPEWIKPNSVGGILVTSPHTYWAVGGMDERFERTWGFEDNAFVAAADTLTKVVRLPGRVYSFSHEVSGIGRDWTELNPNFWRNQLYQHCYGNQKLMRELIKR